MLPPDFASGELSSIMFHTQVLKFYGSQKALFNGFHLIWLNINHITLSRPHQQILCLNHMRCVLRGISKFVLSAKHIVRFQTCGFWKSFFKLSSAASHMPRHMVSSYSSVWDFATLKELSSSVSYWGCVASRVTFPSTLIWYSLWVDTLVILGTFYVAFLSRYLRAVY